MHGNYSNVTFIHTGCIVRRQNRARCRGRKRNDQNKKFFFFEQVLLEILIFTISIRLETIILFNIFHEKVYFNTTNQPPD